MNQNELEQMRKLGILPGQEVLGPPAPITPTPSPTPDQQANLMNTNTEEAWLHNVIQFLMNNNNNQSFANV